MTYRLSEFTYVIKNQEMFYKYSEDMVIKKLVVF